MSVKRKRYSPSEKANVALEAIKGELTMAEMVAKYGVHATQINAWKRQALDHLPDAFSDKNKQIHVDYETQLAELYGQIGRLKVENDFLKKSVMCLSSDRRLLLERDHPQLSIRQQCELLNINRSSIYYTPVVNEMSAETLALMRLVDEIYTRYLFFGTRQMTNYLNLHHHAVERHQIREVYERLGLKLLAPGPHTSKPHPKHKIYPYLLKGIDIVRSNQVWSTDTTFVRLRHGFLYLMAIIDWFSRYVLDWELSINLEADFCIETLARVLVENRCDIFNSDQASQFTSKGFTHLLKSHDIKISMDGKGRALDNVFV